MKPQYKTPSYAPLQRGGTLPVYRGSRYQKGGGVLDSLGHIAKPVGRTFAREALKALPSVGMSIMGGKNPAQAVLQGVKTAGFNTVKELPRIFGSVLTGRRVQKRKRKVKGGGGAGANKRRKVVSKRKKQGKRDIFSA